MDFYHKHNSIILSELGDKKLTKEEQQQYYTPYMTTHLFTDYLPILQKYFSDIFPYIKWLFRNIFEKKYNNCNFK